MCGMHRPQSYLRLIYAQITPANYSLCSANVFRVNCVWSGKAGRKMGKLSPAFHLPLQYLWRLTSVWWWCWLFLPSFTHFPPSGSDHNRLFLPVAGICPSLAGYPGYSAWVAGPANWIPIPQSVCPLLVFPTEFSFFCFSHI